jgi:hypothetical protein
MRTAQIIARPGVDCRIRLFSETPGQQPALLGKFDSCHDALQAKRAAEQALTQLDAALARMSGGKT